MADYELVFIDADDTLFDFRLSEEKALRGAFLESGLAFGPAALAAYRGANARVWADLERGLLGMEELKTRRFEELLAILGVRADPRALGALYLDRLSREADLVEGAREACVLLRGRAKLVLATNGIKEVQRGRLARSGLEGAFDLVVISEEAGFAKPDPRFFEYGARLVGFAERPRALVIGDSLASDIRGGANYGADTCLFDPNGAWTPGSGPAPTHRVRRLSELASIVTPPRGRFG